MGCLKGKDDCKKKDATYKCKKCGAHSKKKSNCCKPEKLKSS